MKNRIVVLGGSGFIGQSLVKKLLENDYQVIVFSHSVFSLDKLKDRYQDKLILETGDFIETEKVLSIIEPEDLVFDLVASSVPSSSMKRPLSDINENIFAHAIFIQKAYEKGAAKIIFTSSGGGVYGDNYLNPISEKLAPNPVSPHAISKLTIEYYLAYFARIYGKKCLVYRISNPYGPHQKAKIGFGVIPTFFTHIQENIPPTLFGNGALMRDFIYIDDLINAMVVSFDKETNYNLYNLGSGESTAVIDLWQLMNDVAGSKISPSFAPIRVVDAKFVLLDISRFTSEFNWQPKTSLRDGLLKCWQYLSKK